jgi:hypothetical protein
MACNSFRCDQKFKRRNLRYDLALERVEENVIPLTCRQREEIEICKNSPNPYSITQTCSSVYNNVNCPMEDLCPPREPKVYYNGTTGIFIGPRVQNDSDVNPFNGIQL